MVPLNEDERTGASSVETPSMLGPIHAFGSGCFYAFGVIYLVFIHSPYLFASNVVFGTLCAANWFVLPRRFGEARRASVFLAIVYLGLVNVAVHLGAHPLPMVFWGMSISIAAAFLLGWAGVLSWIALSLLFYPLTAFLKAGPLAGRVIHLGPFQHELLTIATYVGLLSFLAYSFLLFRNRLSRAIAAMTRHARALAKSESTLAESQRVARIGNYEYDIASGTWTSSPLLDEIFGIDAPYARNVQGWLALVHPEDRDDLARYLAEIVEGREAVFDRQYRLARKGPDGTLWVHGRGVMARDDDGHPTRLSGTIQDISGLKRNEEERRELEARLYHAQKLESLGVLAGGIAHDFNNLLTGILGNVALAQNAVHGRDPAAGELLHRAETAALRAAELTRQMLAFSGKARLVVQPLDVNAAIEEMSRLLTSSIPKLAELHLELDPGAPLIRADASQFQQVVMNVLINAAEAIGDRPGRITVRTSVQRVEVSQLGGAFVSEDFASGDCVCIEVRDTGCGMSDETMDRLFEPFFTTKFTGRGLGLAAVLGIVRGHKGAIALASAPGEGTTFTLLLPCAPPGTSLEPAPPTRSSGDDTARVLVIDDEPLVREIGRQILERAGFEVLEADDGASGLDKVRSPENGIDLVLLDLTMPKMGGVETFRELKQLRPTLPVVLMSGYSRDGVLELFADAAPEDFVEKPFCPEDLLAAVRAALSR